MMYESTKSRGINSKVLKSISAVTSLGLQSYKEAKLMFATANGTIISIIITPCTKSGKFVKLSMTAVAKGMMINFWLMVPMKSFGCNSLIRMPCKNVPSKKSCKTIPAYAPILKNSCICELRGISYTLMSIATAEAGIIGILTMLKSESLMLNEPRE